VSFLWSVRTFVDLRTGVDEVDNAGRPAGGTGSVDMFRFPRPVARVSTMPWKLVDA
jgi:hypothetical protein